MSKKNMFLNFYCMMNGCYGYAVFYVRTAEDCFFHLENRYWNTQSHDDGVRRFALYENRSAYETVQMKCVYVPHKRFVIMDGVGNAIDAYINYEWEDKNDE